MPSLPFVWPWFAAAGLAAAAAPVVIHLLNRRRFRVLEWAAMDFLRDAVTRSRRMIQLRELLLMALRMLCLVLFGLALAQPKWHTASEQTGASDQPVHAVLLVDNSLSMGYQRLGGTLLDEAKATAREIIEKLPSGSRVTVLPTCGSGAGVSYEAYSSAEDAAEALAGIEPVDRATKPAETIDLALEAFRRVDSPTVKQVHLITDQQVSGWSGEAVRDHLQQLPCRLEPHVVTAEGAENAWVADFRLRDGVADVNSPAVFVAAIGYDSQKGPRKGVQVALTIDGRTVATQTVDLQPGQTREVVFPPFQFDLRQLPNLRLDPNKPALVAAEVSLPPDSLPEDDHRFLVVPVVAALPVVFIDSLGRNEDPERNQYGETAWLRRLMAPRTSRASSEQPLIRVRQLKIEEVKRENLADARLVVMAGVQDPKAAVPVLREYVEQGGNLLIAAGGRFDPAAWTHSAWQDPAADRAAEGREAPYAADRAGLGILPLPLASSPVGKIPEEVQDNKQLDVFQMDFASLHHEYFLFEGETQDRLQDLYRPVVFFKAVSADAGEAGQDALVASEAARIELERKDLAEIDKRLGEINGELAKLGPAANGARADRRRELETKKTELDERREQLRPTWLLWHGAREAEEAQPAAKDAARQVKEAAERTRPRVLAKYDNGLPFMVQRHIGRGQVVLVTTGVSKDPGTSTGWSTLPQQYHDAMSLFDRVVRSMLRDTLPPRTISSDEQLALPIAAADKAARFTLVDPDANRPPRVLTVDALSGDRYALNLGKETWLRRGIYHAVAKQGKEDAEATLWDVPLAVNGPADESALVPRDAEALKKSGETSFLELTQVIVFGVDAERLLGINLWQLALLATLVCLLVEFWLLARSSSNREQTT